MAEPFSIVFAIYPDVTQLDFTGPAQVLSRVPGAKLTYASRAGRDGSVFPGGGVTAGIDFALVLAAEIASDEVAKAIQLAIEYAPAPLFDCGRPETMPEALVAMARKGFTSRPISRGPLR